MSEPQACTTERSSSAAPVWQDDSAAIPRERNLVVAWWIALIAAIAVIAGAVILKPDPYAELLAFIGDGLVVTFQIRTTAQLSMSRKYGALTITLQLTHSRAGDGPWMQWKEAQL